MHEFNQGQFIDFLIQNNTIEFYDPARTLEDKTKAYWHPNLRKLYCSLDKTYEFAGFAYLFIRSLELEPDYILCIPDGATPLQTPLNSMIDYRDRSQIPATVLRSQIKSGVDPAHRTAIGPLKPGDRVVLFDDIKITGQNSMRYVPRLQEAGVDVMKVVTGVDKMHKMDTGRDGNKLLKEAYKVEHRTMATATDVLTEICRRAECRPSMETLQKIENNYNLCGVQPLNICQLVAELTV